jgi:hypothetical protein
MDADGRPIGAVVPPAGLRLPSGDLREVVRLYPDDVPYPPSSGNAYAAWALQHLLPMPEDDFRILADVYLLNLVPLLGPTEALESAGGRYRIHDTNRHYASRLRLDRVRATLRVTHATHRYMKQLADSLGLAGFPEPDRDDRSLVFLTHRLISRKLEPGSHPFHGDSTGGLALRGTALALRRVDLTPSHRLLYTAWFLAMPLAPRRLAEQLSELMLYPERRGRLSALVERARRSQ